MPRMVRLKIEVLICMCVFFLDTLSIMCDQRQSINQVYFQVNMYKNEQKVQLTVIHVQGYHDHLIT